jgi:repressor LexA
MIPSPRTLRRQRAILDYIQHFKTQHSYAPTVRQIQRHLRLRSPSAVTYHLAALERAGLLHRSGCHARNLALVPEQPTTRVPLIGDLVAGQPLPDPAAQHDTGVTTRI